MRPGPPRRETPYATYSVPSAPKASAGSAQWVVPGRSGLAASPATVSLSHVRPASVECATRQLPEVADRPVEYATASLEASVGSTASRTPWASVAPGSRFTVTLGGVAAAAHDPAATAARTASRDRGRRIAVRSYRLRRLIFNRLPLARLACGARRGLLAKLTEGVEYVVRDRLEPSDGGGPVGTGCPRELADGGLEVQDELPRHLCCRAARRGPGHLAREERNTAGDGGLACDVGRLLLERGDLGLEAPGDLQRLSHRRIACMRGFDAREVRLEVALEQPFAGSLHVGDEVRWNCLIEDPAARLIELPAENLEESGGVSGERFVEPCPLGSEADRQQHDERLRLEVVAHLRAQHLRLNRVRVHHPLELARIDRALSRQELEVRAELVAHVRTLRFLERGVVQELAEELLEVVDADPRQGERHLEDLLHVLGAADRRGDTGRRPGGGS